MCFKILRTIAYSTGCTVQILYYDIIRKWQYCMLSALSVAWRLDSVSFFKVHFFGNLCCSLVLVACVFDFVLQVISLGTFIMQRLFMERLFHAACFFRRPKWSTNNPRNVPPIKPGHKRERRGLDTLIYKGIRLLM